MQGSLALAGASGARAVAAQSNGAGSSSTSLEGSQSGSMLMSAVSTIQRREAFAAIERRRFGRRVVEGGIE